MNKKLELTILTEPVDYISYLKRRIKISTNPHASLGGHYAVTRSLMAGLGKLDVTDYNYQPIREGDIYPNVHVLAGVNALKYAIKLKEQGRIKRITAGPNIVVFPNDANCIVENRMIDKYLQPSEWCRDLFIDMCPSLRGRCEVWAAGIDETQFKPKAQNNKKIVLVYYKMDAEQFLHYVIFLLQRYNFEPVLLRCGNYTLEQYILLLNQARFMVSLSQSESQGLFLTEAWGMDVPTLCYNPRYCRINSKGLAVDFLDNISSCPYLTSDTGVDFSCISEFERILAHVDDLLTGCKPREWVISNMTDEVCAADFVKKIEG